MYMVYGIPNTILFGGGTSELFRTRAYCCYVSYGRNGAASAACFFCFSDAMRRPRKTGPAAVTVHVYYSGGVSRGRPNVTDRPAPHGGPYPADHICTVWYPYQHTTSSQV